MPRWRAQQTNTYHFCARCGFRQKFEDMIWQNGLLVCSNTNCIDTAIVGSRDLAVAKAISIDRKELTPDPKLVHPTARKDDQNMVLF